MRALRARLVRIDRRTALIAIESVESHEHRSCDGSRFSACVEPVALVVCKPAPARALDMQGNPVDLDALRRDVPALDAEIDAYDQSFDLAR